MKKRGSISSLFLFKDFFSILLIKRFCYDDFMHKKPYFSAVLLMAGVGSRFGDRLPKQYHQLSGQKVYLHTLKTFYTSNLFQEIILACHPSFLSLVKEEIKPFKNIKVIEGGKTRQESSYRSLLACSKTCDYVVIHDAARPLVCLEILQENVKQVQIHKAIDTCIPTTDTLVQSKDQTTIDEIPVREHFLRGQTPQSFAYPLIRKAHEANPDQNASDDCMLVSQLSHKISIVKGSEKNIKITTNLDLYLAEHILRTSLLKKSSTKQSLNKRIYAVTGSSGGMGEAICDHLEKSGAFVVRIHRKSKEHPIDFLDQASIKNGFSKIFKLYGKLDGLINTAGILYKNPLDNLSIQEIETMLHVNLTGLILSCKFAKIKSQGHIINIASSSYFRGRKEYGVYSSTKAAVVNFTQSLAEENTDLFINVLAPQRTNTKMRRENFPEEDPKDLLSPDLIGKTVIDLLQNTSLTGSVIEVRN